MSEKIKISKEDAFEKIDQQIKKGASLIDEGSETFKKSMGRVRRVDDNFENKYKIWLKITTEILDDIFISSNYSFEFKERISSHTEYVSSDWKPDIKYWITKEMIPKIDYLVVLRNNINEFEFYPEENKSTVKNEIKANKNVTNNVSENKYSLTEIFEKAKRHWLIIAAVYTITIIGITWTVFDNVIRVPFQFELDNARNSQSGYLLKSSTEIENANVFEGTAHTSKDGGCLIKINKVENTIDMSVTIENSEPRLFPKMEVGNRISLESSKGNYFIDIQRIRGNIVDMVIIFIKK